MRRGRRRPSKLHNIRKPMNETLVPVADAQTPADFTPTLQPLTADSEAQARASRIRSGLDQFYGTEQYYRLTMYRWLVATDGVAWLCEKAGSHWLLDLIGSHIATKRRLQAEPFQVWELRYLPADAKNDAIVTCKTDTHGNVLCQQLIPYTNFPLPEGIKLYVELTEDANGNRLFVVLLPSEH